jgi:hypothetical protein
MVDRADPGQGVGDAVRAGQVEREPVGITADFAGGLRGAIGVA